MKYLMLLSFSVCSLLLAAISSQIISVSYDVDRDGRWEALGSIFTIDFNYICVFFWQRILNIAYYLKKLKETISKEIHFF